MQPLDLRPCANVAIRFDTMAEREGGREREIERGIAASSGGGRAPVHCWVGGMDDQVGDLKVIYLGLLIGQYWAELFRAPMVIHGRNKKSTPNPLYFGYPNPKSPSAKPDPETETHGPKIR